MAVVRRGLMGIIVAIIGIAAAFGVGFPAGARPGSRHRAQELATALKKCRHDKAKSRREKCEKTAEAKSSRRQRQAATGARAPVREPPSAPRRARERERRPGRRRAPARRARPGGTTTAPPTTGPEPAPELIPSGVVAISVKASACSPPGTPACSGREQAWTPPHGMYVLGPSPNREAVAEMIATIEGLPLVPNASEYECPRDLVGEPSVELQFRESLQGEALVQARRQRWRLQLPVFH